MPFDSVDDDIGRREIERAGERDRFAQTESMAGEERHVPRQVLLGQIDTVDSARPIAAARCIDADERIETGPVLEHRQHIAAARHERHVRWQRTVEHLGDRGPEAVVAPVGIAQAQDKQGPRHVRCTDSLRKCAEHEMHGS